jgi:hypothetical protein
MLDPLLDRLGSESDVPVAYANRREVAAPHERVDQRPRNAQDGGDVCGSQQSLDGRSLVRIRRVLARDHAP